MSDRDALHEHEGEPTVKSIQVFDPALCCSTGVCGVDVDPALVSFSADVAWAQQQGARIERFNLAQEPTTFAENPTVRGFLERSGQEALPLILVDGEVALAGRYPQRAELARWAGLLMVASVETQDSCCGGSTCC
jgi:thiamine pyrophosphate-dependent acetolactate synthase large subunit-like protein